MKFNGKTVTVNGVVVNLPYSESAEYAGCYFKTISDDPYGFTEEWQNAPMADGVVYRTAERFLGNPVYVVTFSHDIIGNFGIHTLELPDFSWNVNNVLVSISGIIHFNSYNDEEYMLPAPILGLDVSTIQANEDHELICFGSPTLTVDDNGIWNGVEVREHSDYSGDNFKMRFTLKFT